MKAAIEDLTGEEVVVVENGIEWTEFDELNNKITLEESKVVYEAELEDGSKSTLRVSRDLFEKDVSRSTYRIYDLFLMYNEGDRDNSLFEDEGFVKEDVIFDIDDKEFILDN